MTDIQEASKVGRAETGDVDSRLQEKATAARLDDGSWPDYDGWTREGLDGPDADFVAVCTPDTILSLLAEKERLGTLVGLAVSFIPAARYDTYRDRAKLLGIDAPALFTETAHRPSTPEVSCNP